MPQDLKTILQKSLDEVDRARKLRFLGLAGMAIAVEGGLVWLGHISRTADVKTLLVYSVVVLLAGEVATAVVTWSVVGSMTRKTLKAIELLSKE